MSKTKHTPGPWRVQVTGHSFVVEAHTHTEVISVDENGNPCRWSEYNEANARLIAAAPEMLAALETAYMALIGYLPAHRNDVTDAAISAARAAIAKATGGAE